jgi:hypothetical protein
MSTSHEEEEEDGGVAAAGCSKAGSAPYETFRSASARRASAVRELEDAEGEVVEYSFRDNAVKEPSTS